MRSVRRGATGISGVLAVDKPAGVTSHDVVAALRRATGEGRVGHAGTLDPLATGLLVVLFGSATRLERYLVGHDKRYEARIVFGSTTDTLDAEGTVTERAPVPELVAEPAYAQRLLDTFVGSREQVPPAHSAIKTAGVPAYRHARAGRAVTLAPRTVTVHEARLLAVDTAQRAWDVAFTVSKGTYVRALARDIGLAAGTVAHLGALRRLASGALDLSCAVPLDAAVEAADTGALVEHFVDPVALLGYPPLPVASEAVADGRPILPEQPVAEGGRVCVVTQAGLAAIYVARAGVLYAETVLVPEVLR